MDLLLNPSAKGQMGAVLGPRAQSQCMGGRKGQCHPSRDPTLAHRGQEEGLLGPPGAKSYVQGLGGGVVGPWGPILACRGQEGVVLGPRAESSPQMGPMLPTWPTGPKG